VLDDAGRFRALFDANFVAIVGYAARRLDDSGDAADVAAEVFAIAWRRMGEVPTGPNARPWLFGVARNVVSNHTRSTRRRGHLVARLRSQLDTVPAEASAASADVIALREAMSALSDEDQELLRLVSWEGLSPTEIAVALGIPAGTVRSRLHRARQALRTALDPTNEATSSIERSTPTGHVGVSEHKLAARNEDNR
jgi:RNA polymerase sigma-70 factor (ECF subfamily)